LISANTPTKFGAVNHQRENVRKNLKISILIILEKYKILHMLNRTLKRHFWFQQMIIYENNLRVIKNRRGFYCESDNTSDSKKTYFLFAYFSLTHEPLSLLLTIESHKILR
jgi:hypothetical protein